MFGAGTSVVGQVTLKQWKEGSSGHCYPAFQLGYFKVLGKVSKPFNHSKNKSTLFTESSKQVHQGRAVPLPVRRL